MLSFFVAPCEFGSDISSTYLVMPLAFGDHVRDYVYVLLIKFLIKGEKPDRPLLISGEVSDDVFLDFTEDLAASRVATIEGAGRVLRC